MKKLKILFACLAIVIGIESSTVAKPVKFVDSWFSYVSGDIQDPNNYVEIPANPGCTGGCVLCVIHVKKKAGSNKPDPDALRALYIESSGFTVAGTFAHGIVQLKPC